MLLFFLIFVFKAVFVVVTWWRCISMQLCIVAVERSACEWFVLSMHQFYYWKLSHMTRNNDATKRKCHTCYVLTNTIFFLFSTTQQNSRLVGLYKRAKYRLITYRRIGGSQWRYFEVNTGHKHYKICFAVMIWLKTDQWNLPPFRSAGFRFSGI